MSLMKKDTGKPNLQILNQTGFSESSYVTQFLLSNLSTLCLLYLSIYQSKPIPTGCAPNHQLKQINKPYEGFCVLIFQHVCCAHTLPAPGGFGRKMNMSDVKKV